MWLDDDQQNNIYICNKKTYRSSHVLLLLFEVTRKVSCD